MEKIRIIFAFFPPPPFLASNTLDDETYRSLIDCFDLHILPSTKYSGRIGARYVKVKKLAVRSGWLTDG